MYNVWQLLLVDVEYHHTHVFVLSHDTAVQSQNAGSAYFASKQILYFIFAEQYTKLIIFIFYGL